MAWRTCSSRFIRFALRELWFIWRIFLDSNWFGISVTCYDDNLLHFSSHCKMFAVSLKGYYIHTYMYINIRETIQTSIRYHCRIVLSERIKKCAAFFVRNKYKECHPPTAIVAVFVEIHVHFFCFILSSI